jgi:hypothetical protein
VILPATGWWQASADLAVLIKFDEHICCHGLDGFAKAFKTPGPHALCFRVGAVWLTGWRSRCLASHGIVTWSGASPTCGSETLTPRTSLRWPLRKWCGLAHAGTFLPRAAGPRPSDLFWDGMQASLWPWEAGVRLAVHRTLLKDGYDETRRKFTELVEVRVVQGGVQRPRPWKAFGNPLVAACVLGVLLRSDWCCRPAVLEHVGDHRPRALCTSKPRPDPQGQKAQVNKYGWGNALCPGGLPSVVSPVASTARFREGPQGLQSHWR